MGDNSGEDKDGYNREGMMFCKIFIINAIGLTIYNVICDLIFGKLGASTIMWEGGLICGLVSVFILTRGTRRK